MLEVRNLYFLNCLINKLLIWFKWRVAALGGISKHARFLCLIFHSLFLCNVINRLYTVFDLIMR